MILYLITALGASPFTAIWSQLGEPDRYPQLLAEVTAKQAAHPSAEGAYLRGRLLHDLGRTHEAGLAFEAAVALDPEYSPARYSYGLWLQKQGFTAKALAQWTAAAEAGHADAAYNGGQLAFRSGDFETSLRLWRLAQSSSPKDIQVAVKIVQALHALDRHDQADQAMAIARSLVVDDTELVIDRFVVNEHRVFVYERVDLDATTGAHWSAVVVDEDGKKLFVVLLEHSEAGRARGILFVDGAQLTPVLHRGYDTAYLDLPEYGRWRALAKTRIEGILQERVNAHEDPPLHR